jgi:hypothetical protein
VLTASQLSATAESIVGVQLATGMIPWFEGGHADPWNHVEAAMALSVAGQSRAAEAAYQWLIDTQHDDGSWCSYYIGGDVEDPRRDTNVSSYVAVGVWHHFLSTGDRGFLDCLFPVVEAAIDFALGLQQPGGEVLWSRENDGSPGRFALLTGSSSVYFSLRCAMAAAEALGQERPDWELAAGRLAHAIAHRPDAFEPKDRWAMDWYYPVLCGALDRAAAQERMGEGWSSFVMDGLGVRCVSDRPWVTAAETAECVMALLSCGVRDEAETLFRWAQHLRHHDGSYWTGCVYPEAVHYPGGERSTYTSAANVLASAALAADSPAARLFLGAGLPSGLDLSEPVRD